MKKEIQEAAAGHSGAKEISIFIFSGVKMLCNIHAFGDSNLAFWSQQETSTSL